MDYRKSGICMIQLIYGNSITISFINCTFIATFAHRHPKTAALIVNRKTIIIFMDCKSGSFKFGNSILIIYGEIQMTNVAVIGPIKLIISIVISVYEGSLEYSSEG